VRRAKGAIDSPDNSTALKLGRKRSEDNSEIDSGGFRQRCMGLDKNKRLDLVATSIC
jgi:hypothetical protein